MNEIIVVSLEWIDILYKKDDYIYRKTNNDKGTYIKESNKLIINWEKWGEEIFIGTPIARTVLDGEKAQRTMLDSSSQSEFQVIIQKIDDRYFWKTREMKELERRQSGLFVTYQAKDGSGYVRIDSSADASSPIGYIEHFHLGLATLTYQGQVSK